MSDPADRADAAVKLTARLAAAASARNSASLAATNFRFRQPTPAELAVQLRAAALAADKQARGAALRPANALRLAELKLCHVECAADTNPARFLELAAQLIPEIQEHGLNAFYSEIESVSLQLSQAAVFAVDLDFDKRPVVRVAGSLMRALADHNVLKIKNAVMHSCRTALTLHGEDGKVQYDYRQILSQYGGSYLDMPRRLVLTAQMLRACEFMKAVPEGGRPADTPSELEVMKTLVLLHSNALFVLMDNGEQGRWKQPVCEFAAWCLTTYTDPDVGNEACVLLYQAAICMQLDTEYLVETDRLALVDLKVPELMFALEHRRNARGGPSSDARTNWLFSRVSRDPRRRLMDDGLGFEKRQRAGGSA